LKGFSNFQYLGKLKKYESDEIKSRIAAGKRCLYSLRCRLRSRCTNKAIKINISDMKVKPVAVYRSATWRESGRYEKTEYMLKENIKKDI
jgi:hypothetical protein